MEDHDIWTKENNETDELASIWLDKYADHDIEETTRVNDII